MQNKIRDCLRAGNGEFASHFIKPIWKLDQFYLNQLHFECASVKNEKDLYDFHRNSTNKNCHTFGGITPMHCAAVNPNEKIIQALAAKGGDINLGDQEGWQPIHYAAACEGPGPLKFLIGRGANVDT